MFIKITEKKKKIVINYPPNKGTLKKDLQMTS